MELRRFLQGRSRATARPSGSSLLWRSVQAARRRDWLSVEHRAGIWRHRFCALPWRADVPDQPAGVHRVGPDDAASQLREIERLPGAAPRAWRWAADQRGRAVAAPTEAG